MKDKKIIIVSSVIIAVLVLTIGATYSIFSLSKVSKNSNLVVGDIYMHYNETTNAINITDMMPLTEKTYNITGVDTTVEKVNICANYVYSHYGKGAAGPSKNNVKEKSNTKFMSAATGGTNSNIPSYNDATAYNNFCQNSLLEACDDPRGLTTKEKEYLLNQGVLTGTITDNVSNLDYFEFTVDGKNTHTKNGVVYNIQLVYGDVATGKTENNRIQDDKLRFRLVSVNDNKETIIEDNLTLENINGTTIYTDIISANTTTEITRTYRLYIWIDSSVNICSGDTTANCDYTLTEWSNLFASIKVNVNGKYTVPTNFVETVKNKYSENNQDGIVAVNTRGDLASSTDTIREYRYSGTNVKNYLKFNNETWRIVGIFNEENADGVKEERIKLVKDEPISNDLEAPTTITKNNVSYRIVKPSPEKYRYFYWNSPYGNYSGNYSDWTKAGSMYYLNENYLNGLKNSDLIENMKYYLGNVTIDTDDTYNVYGTNKEIYLQERASTECGEDVYSNSHKNSCNIWNGNQASWSGKIALLYPSDFVYATSSTNWSQNANNMLNNGIAYDNWLFNENIKYEWFLSPASNFPNSAVDWNVECGLDYGDANRRDASFRPVLSLGSQAMIISGSGSINDPYLLKTV